MCFQNEPITLISHVIRTVGLGAAWFSDCFLETLLDGKNFKLRGEDLNLTDREMEVANLVVDALSNRQTAHALSVRERTVEFHMTNILQKLDLDNRVSVAMWAKERC